MIRTFNIIIAVACLTALHGQNAVNTSKVLILKNVDCRVGLNISQGQIGHFYYAPTSSFSYNLNIELLKYKGLSLVVGGAGFKKIYYGSYPNDSFLKIKREDPQQGMAPGSSPGTQINFEIKYFAIDYKIKYEFNTKRKLRPFVYLGLRQNVLDKYKYLSLESDPLLDYFIIPNLKKSHFNTLIGTGILYKFYKNSAVLIAFELNRDGKQYMTGWGNGATTGLDKSEQDFYGGKFDHLFIQLGYQITFH